jgi:hypothetical protein
MDNTQQVQQAQIEPDHDMQVEVSAEREQEIRAEINEKIQYHVGLSAQTGETNLRKAYMDAAGNVISSLLWEYRSKPQAEYQFAMAILNTIVSENDFTTESEILYSRQGKIRHYINLMLRESRFDHNTVGSSLQLIRYQIQRGRAHDFFKSEAEVNYAIAITIEE